MTSDAALGLRMTEQHCGDSFYGRMDGGGEQTLQSSAKSVPPSAVRLAGLEEQECTLEPTEIHALSLRLSRFAGKCPGAVLWLQLPGTALDYPVMLGADNRFYLDHLPDGSKNSLGSLFLDCRTNADSTHLIVYGHNGSGGRMLGLLKQYGSESYYLEHKTLSAATVDTVYVCPVFSVRRVEAGSDAYRLEFGDDRSLGDYIRQAAAESLYETDADVEGAAGVLTLSTCTGWGEQRLIVQAVITSSGD